jgi:hypothetical protein
MEKIKNVASDIQTIISIGEKIIHQHTHLGAESPLNSALVADLNSRISRAKEKHEEGAKYQKLMEDAWKERDHYLGNEDKGVLLTMESIFGILTEQSANVNSWGFLENADNESLILRKAR